MPSLQARWSTKICVFKINKLINVSFRFYLVGSRVVYLGCSPKGILLINMNISQVSAANENSNYLSEIIWVNLFCTAPMFDCSLIWIRDNASVEMLQSKKNDQHAYRIRNTLKNNILPLISLDLKPRAKLSNIQQCCLCMCKRTQQLPTITACVCCTGLQLRCTIYKLYINRCMQ